MRWLVALLWAAPLWGQAIAEGDSVEYNSNRYRVVFVAGAAIFQDDADFEKRKYNPNKVHVDIKHRRVSWMDPSCTYVDSVAADHPLLRLQKTFVEIDAASKTTGLVIYRNGDPVPLVDIPVGDVTKIEPEE